MKKDLSNIIKNMQNTDIPPFPLDNSELSSVLDRVDRSESSGNSKHFTKRGITMTSIITSILMLGIFGINYLSNDPQPATVKSQTAKVKQENMRIEENRSKEVVNDLMINNQREVTSAIESEKVEPEKKRAISLSFDQDTYDFVTSDTAASWDKLGYDNYSNKFYFTCNMNFTRIDSSKSQSIQFYKYIETAEALSHYKELYSSLVAQKIPNLDKIAFAKDDKEFKKLYDEATKTINWQDNPVENTNKLTKFVLLATVLNNKPSSINIINLDINELKNLGINYGDSSLYYNTESYFVSFIGQDVPKDIVSKYKDSPVPALIKHKQEIQWKYNPKGIGTVVLIGTDEYEKRNEKNIFIQKDFIIPYDGWSNKEFCMTCPVMTGTGKSIKYDYSPLGHDNTILKEYYMKYTETQVFKQLLKRLLAEEFNDSTAKSVIQKDSDRWSVYSQAYQNRILMNYLVPVEIKFPYFKSTDSSYDQISEVLWYLPTKEFVEALPERYRNVLSRELKAIEMIESGKMMPEEACKGLSGEETFFELCKLSSESVKDITVYPNPFNDNGKIKFFLLNDRIVNMTIHDVSGNYIKTLLNWEKLQKGEQIIDFDMNGLQSGIYIINISTDNSERVNKRFVKL